MKDKLLEEYGKVFVESKKQIQSIKQAEQEHNDEFKKLQVNKMVDKKKMVEIYEKLKTRNHLFNQTQNKLKDLEDKIIKKYNIDKKYLGTILAVYKFLSKGSEENVQSAN